MYLLHAALPGHLVPPMKAMDTVEERTSFWYQESSPTILPEQLPTKIEHHKGFHMSFHMEALFP